MKSDIFIQAILNRYKVRFLYNLNEITVDPYLITSNKSGKKVVYGRVNNTNEIRFFEYDKIMNLRTMSRNQFSPIIPIIPTIN